MLDMCGLEIEEDLGTCEVCGIRPATTQCHAWDCDNACCGASEDGDPPCRCCDACMVVDPSACVEICGLCAESWAEALGHECGDGEPCDACTFEALAAKVKQSCIAAIWLDGPDSEAARAHRGEGTLTARVAAAFRQAAATGHADVLGPDGQVRFTVTVPQEDMADPKGRLTWLKAAVRAAKAGEGT